jgi:leader peptidase (prepilin peptidase)/N-methyltransferase
MGSFATAVISRTISGQSWIKSGKGGAARSECPKCSHELRASDLIPVLSFLLQRGRCRYCRAQISAFYPVIELLSITLSLVFLFVFGVTALSFLLIAIMPFVLAQVIVYYRKKLVSMQLLLTICILVSIYILIEIFMTGEAIY